MKVWHYSITPGEAICSADEVNMRTTVSLDHVDCPNCRDMLCLLCGAYSPGYVEVHTDHGRLAGRVCSHHSLRQVIMADSQEFMVQVTINQERPPWLGKPHAD
jgi:hypothetical protein